MLPFLHATGPSSSTSPSTPGTSSRISNSADEPSALLEPALPTATPEQVAALTDAADKIGNLLQNHHQVCDRPKNDLHRVAKLDSCASKGRGMNAGGRASVLFCRVSGSLIV
jgi:hypothetical protein